MLNIHTSNLQALYIDSVILILRQRSGTRGGAREDAAGVEGDGAVARPGYDSRGNPTRRHFCAGFVWGREATTHNCLLSDWPALPALP